MTAVLPVRRPGAAQPLSPAEDTRSASDRSAGPARTLGLLAPWLVRGMVGLAVAVFALLAVGPHVLGYRTMTMLTGSMSPMIDPGDVTVVTPIAVEDVTEGMVLTYHQPIGDRSLVTHRVVEVQRDAAGTVTIRTRGDANEAIDPWTATLEGDTAYRVRAVVPELGHLIQALRAPVVTQVLLYGAPALLAGWLLMSIWRPTTDTREEDQA
jgi:signal peptidase I